MNHTENYKKYAYRSILIMMLGVVFFILFGSRLISQNVYAESKVATSYYSNPETYVDIVEFEKRWIDKNENDRPESITIEATFKRQKSKGNKKYYTEDIKESIELTKANDWKNTLTFNSDTIVEYVEGSIIEINGVPGYEYNGEQVTVSYNSDKKKNIYITLTNKKLPTATGNLIVSKDVNGNKGDTNKDFHFTVTLSDSYINGTYGDMTFKNGVATFTLKDNESLTATSLPTGISYKVIEQEANQDGYITTSTGTTGEIEKDVTSKAEFINTKNEYGSLTVSKDVNGNKGDTNKDFHFTVTLSDTSINGTFGDMTFKDGVATFTLKDNESLTATSLPTGITYKVIEQEANQDGYITTSTGTTGEIQKNATSKAEFINTKNEYGSLTVSKDVNGNKGDTNKDFHFTVTLSDTSINGTFGDMTFKDGVATFTLKDNESLTATSLPTGITYKVTEQEANQDGYVTTSTNDKGYILNNQNIKVDFINTKEVKLQSSNQTPLKNDRQSQPQTDDDSALMVYMSLGIMSGLSALGLILLKKKA